MTDFVATVERLHRVARTSYLDTLTHDITAPLDHAGLDSIPDPVAVFDAAGRIRGWNAAMETMTQRPRWQALGHNPADLWPGFGERDDGAALRRALAGHATTREHIPYVHHADQGQHVWTARYRPLPQGGAYLLLEKEDDDAGSSRVLREVRQHSL